MTLQNLTVEIRLAWWLRLYLRCVVLYAALTLQEPDEEKLAYWISRGISIK